MSNHEDVKYTTDEKLRWEIEKLRAEVDGLRRAPYRNPNLLLTALVGLAGIGLQYANSARTYTLAQKKTEQAKLDIVKLDAKRAETDSLFGQAVRELGATTARREEGTAARSCRQCIG
jgi:hypothetical protein